MTQAKPHVARPLNSLSDFNSQVDIVIPYHGQYELVTRLLESIFRLTRSNYYRIVVVDDSSPNPHFSKAIERNARKNADRFKQPCVLKTIRNEQQLGFAGSCRVGFEAGESPFVCFINSDCRVEDSGWLTSLGEALLAGKEQGVRVVAPRTNNPCGGDEAQLGQKNDRTEGVTVLSDDSFLSLYCFMCHRELFGNIGGFLKEYPYGYFEDEEFAARLRKHGFKQAVSLASWVHHDGMATIKPLWRTNPSIRDQMVDANRERCIEDMKALA